jgi:hypothetical protein
MREIRAFRYFWPGAAFGAKLGGLGIKRLPVGADAGIAKAAILGFGFGHIFRKA